MTNHDDDLIQIATEKFERRLAEESGSVRVEIAGVRVEIAGVRAEMREGFGDIRLEMADRNADLLKWALVFGATQTAAIAGVVALLR